MMGMMAGLACCVGVHDDGVGGCLKGGVHGVISDEGYDGSS